MSNKTRSILRVIAILLVIVSVAMQLEWIIVPSLREYKFWLVIIAFGTLLIASK